MDPQTFLRELFAAAQPGGLIEVRRVPSLGHPSLWFDPSGDIPDIEGLQDSSYTWLFSLCLRNQSMEVSAGTVVWVDIDAKTTTPPDPATILPRPSMAVSSGGGLHVYWVLDEQVDAATVVRLSRLGAMLLSGDPKVVEPSRVFRLPGSFNTKYDPPRPCEVSFVSGLDRWNPEILESALIANIVRPYWDGGIRHALALAMSGVLAKAGWSEARCVRLIEMLCDLTDDEQRVDRIVCARGTVRNYLDGKHISTRDFRDILGDEAYKELLAGLGVLHRDGELIYRGEAIGHTSHMDSALVAGFLKQELVGWADGNFVKWSEPEWRSIDEKAVASTIFSFMEQVKEIQQGDELPFVASVKFSTTLSTVVRGALTEQPLPDMPAHILPLKNGLLDLTDMSFRPIEKQDYVRKTLGASYDPEAECPRWMQFLNEAAPEEAAFLQEWVGYCLIPDNPWQRMLWLYGPSGTGKSKFLDVVGALFGSTAVAFKADAMTDYAIASLAGSRVATCSELSNRTLRTSLIKSLVGGDAVTARNPYGRQFTFRYTGKFIWASNGLPQVDQGEGMWRRLVIVPFINKPVYPDVNLYAVLMEELPGIFNWALEGRERVLSYLPTSRWDMPATAKELVKEYEDSADLFAQFVAQEMELGSDFKVNAKELYQRYAAWAKENGIRQEPQGPIFRREMARFKILPAGDSSINGKPVMMWTGGRLRPDVFAGNLIA